MKKGRLIDQPCHHGDDDMFPAAPTGHGGSNISQRWLPFLSEITVYHSANRCVLNVCSVKIMDQGHLSSRSSGWREKLFSHGRTMSNPRLHEGKGR